MAAPERLVEHLRQAGYHPRSNKQGKSLCEFMLKDLLVSCPRIARDAADGKLVYDEQRKIMVGTSEWNIDLVLGPPATEGSSPSNGIRRSPPSTIRIAVEAKTIMTEHGKARRNRQRDLDSFHQFAHRSDPDTIAAALTVVNLADRFKSPLRPEISVHRGVKTLVQTTLDLLRTLPTRSATSEMSGLEANGAIVVWHDNIDSGSSRLVTTPPAPQVGDPIHYSTFLRRICDRYIQRWP
jgi:hypothetical protein